MSWYSFYDPATGAIAGWRWSGPDTDLSANTPPGFLPVPGALDHLSQRVELVTDDFGDQVPVAVDHQPPAPPDTEWEAWAWDIDTKRWRATPTLAARARTARTERDRRLALCDWVTTRALDLAQPVPAPWAAYRQQLRDVPEQSGFPDDITWPTPPET